jgi:NAD(P)H-dependent FMN reductase
VSPGLHRLRGVAKFPGMSDGALQVLAVVGSLKKKSVTRVVVGHIAQALAARGCVVDVLDLLNQPLALYNPESAHQAESYPSLKGRVDQADVYVLGTPDYHGSISSAMKNFLDHFWHEFSGKLFATVVASHEKGLTVTDQLRTVARQCYAWCLPYGVACIDREDVKDGAVCSAALEGRLDMFVRDVEVYGRVLARQRREDLAGNEPGFMARHRRSH